MGRFARAICASLLAVFAVGSSAWADGQAGALKNVETVDAATTCFGYKLVVSNGTLTNNNDGTCTVTTAGNPLSFSPASGNAFELFNGGGLLTISDTTNALQYLTIDSNTNQQQIILGGPGVDGKLQFYSEQGAVDYYVSLAPNAAMTKNTDYTLPAADGTSGQVLSTNGSGVMSWIANGSGHNILSSTHSDSVTASAVRGDLIVANSTPNWARFAVGGSNTVLTANGADPAWSATPTLTSLTLTGQFNLNPSSGTQFEWFAGSSLATFRNATNGVGYLEANGSTNQLTIGDPVNVPSIRFQTDGTGDDEIQLPDSSIGAREIAKGDGFAWTGLHNFTTGSLAIPNSGTRPATCIVGQVYMDTSATSGQRVYGCETANSWVLEGDGGGGGGGSPAGSGSELQYRVNGTTFGAVTTSSVSGGNVTLQGNLTLSSTTTPQIQLTPTAGNAFEIHVNGGLFSIADTTNARQLFQLDSNQQAVYLNQTSSCRYLQTNAQGRVLCQSSNVDLWLSVVSAKLPASNPCLIDGANARWRLLCDPTTNQSAQWSFVMPYFYGGGPLSVEILYSMVSGTTSNVIFQGKLMAMTPGATSADVDVDSFGTTITCTDTVPATAGDMRRCTMNFTNGQADSVLAGDLVAFDLTRNAVADGAAGNAEIRAIHIYE